MSITVSGALGAVLDGVTQEVGVRVTLDLPVGPYTDFSGTLRSLSLSAQNGTDLPEEVREVVGFTATGGEIVLAGSVDPGGDQTKTVAWLLNPDETTSPLYRTGVKGTRVTIDLGYRVRGVAGLQWVRKFTGSIASYSLEHDDGTATLNIVDRSVDYDSTPEIPGVATAAPYNAGLTAEFPMDAIIRSGGRDSSWPKTRAGALLAVGMRSSVWPDTGALTSWDRPPQITFDRGHDNAGSALHCGNYENVLPYTLAGNVATLFRVEAWVKLDQTAATKYVAFVAGDGNPSLLDEIDFFIDGTSSGLFYRTANTSGYFGPAMDDGQWHHVVLCATLPAAGGVTFTVTGEIDGVTYSGGTHARDVARGSTVWNSARVAGQNCWIEQVQFTAEPAAAPSNFTFLPAAYLDVSLNPLTVVPAIPAATKGSDELQTIAAAELGYARFDEQGVFRFTNRQTIAAAGIARTITADTGLKTGLSTDVGASTEYDHIQVPFTAWTADKPQAVFVLADVKKIPAHQTLTWTQPFNSIATNLDPTAALLPDSHDPNDGGTWYRASVDPYGTGPHPGLTITATPISSGSVTIAAVNGTGQDAYLTTPATYTDLAAGSASSGLWIGGTPVNPADEALTDSTYGSGMHPALVVQGNAYSQSQAAAQGVGDYLLPQLFTAIRDFTGVAVIPDPRVQVTDKIRLVDPYRSKVDEYAQVWGWQFSAEFPAPGETGGTWDMTLDLRALGPPGAWLAGIPGRSEIGTSAYAYA